MVLPPEDEIMIKSHIKYFNGKSKIEYFLGFLVASFFSLAYFFAPIYILACLYMMVFNPLGKGFTMKFITPMVLSILTPCISAPGLLKKFAYPMLEFFEYEEIFETTFADADKLLKDGKNFLLIAQPHGVLSYAGFCAKITCPKKYGQLPTAVAAALLHFPILKQVMGMFTLIDASARNMAKVLKKDGPEGCIILYVGGIAELFKCSLTEERLYLSKRKGFVKLALREGVDIIPAYFFGNTSILSILKTGPLASLSRKIGGSLTYFWGLCGLPLPRFGQKCMYVRGRPLGLPHIEKPTQEDIDKWHKIYCDEVERIYYKYREKCPHYANKPLFID